VQVKPVRLVRDLGTIRRATIAVSLAAQAAETKQSRNAKKRFHFWRTIRRGLIGLFRGVWSALRFLGVFAALAAIFRLLSFVVKSVLPATALESMAEWRSGVEDELRLRRLPTSRTELRLLLTNRREAGYSMALLLMRRQITLVRRFSKRLAEPTWRLATSDRAAAYMLFAARHRRWRPRLMTRALLSLAEQFHVLVLSVQLGAGQTERALKLARTLNLIFRHRIRKRARPTCLVYFEALFRVMRFDRIVKEVPTHEIIDDHYLNHQIGVAHLYALNGEQAVFFLKSAIAIHNGSYSDHRMLGRAYMLENQLTSARASYRRSVELLPLTVMAHQNYAGRYDVLNYKPKKFELQRADILLVYDNLGQFAEDLFLQGRFHDSFRHYQRMLDYQRRIAPGARIPGALLRRLASQHPTYNEHLPIRLLPYEWVIQFGHIGLLDIYMKMAILGMYPKANYIVLAPKSKVANPEFLRYWERHYIIVTDEDLIDDLFPYQRYIGDNFMAYPSDTGEAEPWTRAGARAQVRWAAEGRPPLLSLTPEDRNLGERMLAELGVPKDAWYVGLHVREAGFYAEASSGISTHRNASIADYEDAIREITSRGGWVIRLGDNSMKPLSPRERIIDYAVSRQKSPSMDMFLLATSRFVVGTTSGLTTACLSFGTPMVLCNCISNDWQLWTGQTDFIPKRLRERRTGRYLTVGETYRMPVQGYLINNVVTNAKGYEIVSNTAEEIAEAVRYKLDLLDGNITRPKTEDRVLAAYWHEMRENPYMFGAAVPVRPFLVRHPELCGAVPPSKFQATG
jgi:putative glycosyltransferase (TIGR04372 family)